MASKHNVLHVENNAVLALKLTILHKYAGHQRSGHHPFIRLMNQVLMMLKDNTLYTIADKMPFCPQQGGNFKDCEHDIMGISVTLRNLYVKTTMTPSSRCWE